MPNLRRKWEHLGSLLQRQKRVLVAFSGGCDSAFLLHAAIFFLGKENVLAVTAVSASLSEKERSDAVQIAEEWGASHQLLKTGEMSNPQYVQNPSNRCFFCKNELFENLFPIAQQQNRKVIDGLNFSDRAEDRPGMLAAKNWGVDHPLDDAQLEKNEIRVLSRWRKLRTWNKPAAPCLSSRIPHGTPVLVETLQKIEKAEAVLHAAGFSVARVRYFGEEARIEVEKKKVRELLENKFWEIISSKIKACGFLKVSVDLGGFRSGKLQQSAQEGAFQMISSKFLDT